jgi:hypothetical protein
MFPATVNINVTYEEGIIYNDLQPLDRTTADFAIAPAIVSYAAFYGLDQAILHGQSLTRNLIGDSIAQIYANQDQPQAPLSYPDIWVGSFLRQFANHAICRYTVPGILYNRSCRICRNSGWPELCV